MALVGQLSVVSHESSGDNPLSLSLTCQSTLGIAVDAQHGTCRMRHPTGPGPDNYEFVQINPYKVKDNDLYAICVSDLPPSEHPETDEDNRLLHADNYAEAGSAATELRASVIRHVI